VIHLRLVKAAIVIEPAPDRWIAHTHNILQRSVRATRQVPAAYRLTDLLQGLGADSWTEIGKSFVPFLYSMFEWGKSYASYLVARGNRDIKYQPGVILANIDELVKTESENIVVKQCLLVNSQFAHWQRGYMFCCVSLLA
jgi:hypothetical protein